MLKNSRILAVTDATNDLCEVCEKNVANLTILLSGVTESGYGEKRVPEMLTLLSGIERSTREVRNAQDRLPKENRAWATA